jgi:hypothetical protein
LNFGDTSTRTAGTLTINDWSGSLSGGGTDQIIFANALDPTFLSNINFTGFSPGAVQLGDGEIVPVPEPATWVVGAMVLGLIGAGCKAGFAPRSSAATEAPRTAGVSRSGRG